MIESISEYERRKASNSSPSALSQDVSYAVDSARTVYPKEGQLIGALDMDHLVADSPHYSLLDNSAYYQDPSSHPAIAPNSPFITSNCPGYLRRVRLTLRWVCYAEKKTHALVPFLSTTRSAQQVGFHSQIN